MLFGDVIAIALSIFGFLLSLQGLWLLCRALWPGRVSAAAGHCERHGVGCFFLGLVLTGMFALIAGIIGKTLGTFGQLSAFALGFLFTMYAGIGSSGLVTHIGQRLSSPIDAERPWRATIRGGIALEMACLIPILGWLGLLPISLIVGAGATTLALVRPHRAGTTPAYARQSVPRPTSAHAAPSAPLPPPPAYANDPVLPVPRLEPAEPVGAA